MIVLETHAWFWLVASPDRLSEQAAVAVDGADRLGVSAMSCWEIAMLTEKGRVDLDRPAQRSLEDALARSGAARSSCRLNR
ncbi:type II toxin-antitoxin system VapC family toxin [Sorangium sp. So ce124]|uniref:type II toxin-antitoxin system VapC family toxin n=1 Tax=Sorangium sp. So ce124 TaxID=3133280 RepID=UPI003F6201C1